MDWREDKSSFLQDESGRLSGRVFLENCRVQVSVWALMALVIYCAISAFEAWGFLAGLFFGVPLSAALGFGLFALIADRPWAQWTILAIVSYVGVMFALAIGGVGV